MDRIYRIKTAEGGRYAVERDGNLHWMNGDVFGDYSLGDSVPPGAPHRFLAPVMPSIVVCIGLNYKDHAAEMNKKLPAEPLVFLKPQSAVIGPDDEIRLPAWAGRIEHEAEMAVVIGTRLPAAAEKMNQARIARSGRSAGLRMPT